MSSVAAVLIVIAIVVIGEYTKTRGRFLLSALMMEGYFFCSLGPVWVWERRPGSLIAKIAAGFAGFGLFLLLIGLWGTPNSDAFWKSAAIVTILALALSYFAVGDVQGGRLSNSIHAKALGLATVIACMGIAAGINWPPYWWVFTLAVIGWVLTTMIPAIGYLKSQVQRR